MSQTKVFFSFSSWLNVLVDLFSSFCQPHLLIYFKETFLAQHLTLTVVLTGGRPRWRWHPDSLSGLGSAGPKIQDSTTRPVPVNTPAPKARLQGCAPLYFSPAGFSNCKDFYLMGFLLKVVGFSPVIWEELGIESVLLSIKTSQLSWSRHLIKILWIRIFWETQCRPKSHWRDYKSPLAWYSLGIPQENLESIIRQRDLDLSPRQMEMGQ